MFVTVKRSSLSRETVSYTPDKICKIILRRKRDKEKTFFENNLPLRKGYEGIGYKTLAAVINVIVK